MQKMICIPAERYYRMVESYHEALKKALGEAATSKRAK